MLYTEEVWVLSVLDLLKLLPLINMSHSLVSWGHGLGTASKERLQRSEN